MTLPFKPRLPPTDYQLEYLLQHGEDECWGLLWTQGTGKTKSLIDNAALLLVQGKINGMLVLAPNGVHRNWATIELPKHWPEGLTPYWAFCWDTNRSSTKKFQREFDDFLYHTDPDRGAAQHFGVLCMSYDNLMTDAGKKGSWMFLRRRECLYAADESQRFKEPSSKRNIRVFASSAYAPYKRIASGTPMDKPFDIYSQMRWLDADFWKKTMGIDSFTSFKAHIGNWHKITLNSGVKVDVLNERKPYRNLDELQAVLTTATSRVTEEEAEASLPPKTYRRLIHPLSLEQRAAYDELAEECMTLLTTGQLVTAEHVLTQRLRLAQIGAGFITPEVGAQPVPFADNPRAQRLADLLVEIGPDEPALIWTMFQADVPAVISACQRAGRTAVAYSSVNPEDTLDAWQEGKYHDLIGNLGSGLTEGFTLVRARHCVYYTNTPRLIARAQSEKRVHRIGQTRPVTYYDLLAQGTLDEPSLEAVRRKAGWVGEALGDNPEIARNWLRAALRGEPVPEPGAEPQQTEMDWRAYEEALRGV